MPIAHKLGVALRAISYLPPQALVGHAKRRLRNRLVPRFGRAYLARLFEGADRLPRLSPGPDAVRVAETVAAFCRAKQKGNAETALRGSFTFLNRTVDFGSPKAIDWRIAADEGNHQLWRANLAYMGYVSAAMDRDPAAGLSFAETIAASFLQAANFSSPSDFAETWHPYAASQRALSLCAALVRAPEDLRASPAGRAVERFLRLNVSFVLTNLETELGYNHLERNLSAVAFYGLACASFPREIERALRANYERIIVVSVGDDGVQKERSAMYQALSVQSFRIFAALPFWSADERALIARKLVAIESALAALTLGDGQPAMFNDGWLGEAPATAEIVGDRKVGFHTMPDGGYARLAAGPTVALFDAGPIGADSNPGHGHADFLSVEASIDDMRLLVDPGTFSYSAGAERNASRAWSAHNGPAFSDGRPVEFLGSFKVGRRAAAALTSASEGVEGDQSAAGALAFDGLETQREVRLGSDGLRLVVADRWRGDAGAKASRFLVPADFALEHAGDAIVLTQGFRRVRLTWSGAGVSVSKASWSRRYNIREDAHEIVFTPDGDAAAYVFAIEA